MDHIVLEGMLFSGRHGVRPAEREHPQEFRVDIDVELDLSVPAGSDRLEDTIDYTRLRSIAQRVIEGEPASLVEALASRIADAILDQPMVAAVSVRVAKRPPSMMPISAAAVHIRRTRA